MTKEERATFRLRGMAVSGLQISWEIPHARERASERDVPIFEAERIVRAGSVTRVTFEPDERWRVSGTDGDGRPVDVVVKPVRDEYVRVLTVIRTDE